MAKSDVRITAVTHADRIGAVDAMNAAITSVRGWVEDFNFFSNISVAVRCVVPAGNFPEFKAALRSIGFKFDANSLEVDGDRGADADELTVAINVTFVHDKPDLRRTIPPIPG